MDLNLTLQNVGFGLYCSIKPVLFVFVVPNL